MDRTDKGGAVDRIDLLRIFVRVVECASFTKAAEDLGLPRSSVSTAVRDLEERVGGRLLGRTTRKVAPTPDGEAFYARSLRLIADFEELEELLRPAARPHGRLRVNVPARIGRLVIAPALPGFFALYPDIALELGSTDRAVDLVQEGIDCVIRVGPLADSGLIARRLGELALISCASPRYLAARGVPRHPADLGAHLAVNYVSPSTGRIEPWEWVEDGAVRALTLPAQVSCNGAESYIACALAGLGLIQIPAYDVAGHLAAGELVEVLPRHRPPPMPIAALYPHRRHLSRRLRAFLDWVGPLISAREETGGDSATLPNAGGGSGEFTGRPVSTSVPPAGPAAPAQDSSQDSSGVVPP